MRLLPLPLPLLLWQIVARHRQFAASFSFWLLCANLLMSLLEKRKLPFQTCTICKTVCVLNQLSVRPIRNFEYFRIIVCISISAFLSIESQILQLVWLPASLSASLSNCQSSQPASWLTVSFDNFGCTSALSAAFLWHKKGFFFYRFTAA